MKRALALAALVSLSHAASAMAGAGSGSSGFGGGGGGGGGGGFSGGGGGSGSSCTGDECGGGWWVILVVVALVLAYLAVQAVRSGYMRRRRRERAERVERASAVAADDDAAFASDVVRDGAAQLFREIQAAWDARDRRRLATLVGPELMQEWERRLDDFESRDWHNRVEVVSPVVVEYVGLVNRAADAEDRVTVWIQATLRDYVVDRRGRHVMRNDEDDETTRLREYWTLAKTPSGGWRLASIEQDAEGSHHLGARIVPTPWSDDDRLRDEAVAERATADAAPAGLAPAELADLDFDGPARAAALDLALADGRFDPDLIEASVRRAVAAWTEAVDGDDAALEAVARAEAVQELLYAGDPARATRIVVRGPVVERVRIAALDAAADPPALAVELDVRGRRYVEDRATAAVLRGSRERETEFTERWTFALEGRPEWPWRLAGTGAAALT